jgi:hypothetical protein
MGNGLGDDKGGSIAQSPLGRALGESIICPMLRSQRLSTIRFLKLESASINSACAVLEIAIGVLLELQRNWSDDPIIAFAVLRLKFNLIGIL